MKILKFKIKDKFDFSLNAIILVFALCNIFPLYWAFSSSFKISHQVNKIPPDWFPVTPTLRNYIQLFSSSSALRWAFNSFLIASVTTLLVVLVSALASYAFSKMEFPGKRVLFYIFISTLMIPKEVYIIPLFKINQYFNLINTYTGMILPNVALPFGVFLLKQYFDTISASIRESGKIDGASEWRIFFVIMLPICKAAMGALTILMFVQVWNEYLWQVVMTSKDAMKTLQIGIASMQTDNDPNYGLKMAGACVAAIPMLVIFIAFQKYFTSGVTLGAVKE